MVPHLIVKLRSIRASIALILLSDLIFDSNGVLRLYRLISLLFIIESANIAIHTVVAFHLELFPWLNIVYRLILLLIVINAVVLVSLILILLGHP